MSTSCCGAKVRITMLSRYGNAVEWRCAQCGRPLSKAEAEAAADDDTEVR